MKNGETFVAGPCLENRYGKCCRAPKLDFAKKNDKLVILGGAMGATSLDENGVKSLANLPSLDELRAKLVGMINTPAQRIAMVAKAPAGQVARVIGAYSSKEDA